MKNIKNYEGHYSITKEGKVWSHKSKKFLKPCKNPQGYLRISLCKNGISKNLRVSRLVLQAYVSNPTNKPECNHINGIKTDNRVENLEWSTRSENIQHAFDNGLKTVLKGEELPWTKLTGGRVKKIRLLLKEGLTLQEIGEKFGVTYLAVRDIKIGRTWRHVQ